MRIFKDGGFGTELKTVACKAHKKIVEMLLNQNPGVKAWERFNVLNLVLTRRHEKVVEILLDGMCTAGQYVALEHPSAEDHEGIITLLSQKNLGIDFEDGIYCNVLKGASNSSHIGSVWTLLNEMIDSNVGVEAYGNTLEIALKAVLVEDESKKMEDEYKEYKDSEHEIAKEWSDKVIKR